MLAVGSEGLSCLFLPLLNGFSLLVPFSLIYGYFDGAYVALIPVVTSDTVSSSHLTSALGVVYFLHAIPYLISPPIGGQRKFTHSLFHAYKHTDSHFPIHAKSQSHTSYCSYCLHIQLLVHLYVPAVYLTKSECFMKSLSLRLASGSDRLLHSYILPQWSLSDLQCCDSGCCESDHPLH